MVQNNNKCPRCGNNLISDRGRPYCLQCGESPMTPKERQQWFRDNQAEMVRDLIAHGSDFVVKKWKIKPQLIGHLKRSSEYKEAYPPGAPPPARGAKAGSNGIPPLPPWSDSWKPEVQVKWLEIWEKVEL